MEVSVVKQFNMGCSPCQNYKDTDKSVKRGVLLTSALGTATALGAICHKQGFKLSKLPETKVKDWALFKIKGKHKLNFEEKEIIGLAGGSVLGGLAGGAIFDKKENFKAKLQESLSQMLGNVGVPIACVGGATRIYKKYENDIVKHLPLFKHDKGIKKYINRAVKAFPPVTTTLIALGTGILLGNIVSNFINEKLSGEKQNRQIKGTDFAPHVDDLCLAITLMSPNTSVGSVISKTIPLFLTVPGYQTGIAQKKNN